MQIDLYIYYRVATHHAQQFSNTVVTVQVNLSQQHRIACALKRRPDMTDGYHTWMEVYTSVPSDFAETIEQAIADSCVVNFIHGQRHIESFVNISSCA